MSDTLLILLVSEQTIQNVQFLKWFFGNYLQTVDLLFVSTKKMEENKKCKCIKNALGNTLKFVKNDNIILVNENSLENVQTEIEKFINNNKHKSYITNITGGTKLMSIASYLVFHDKPNSKIFYQPLGNDLQCLYPCIEKHNVNELLTLDEYMKAYGISFKYDNKCLKDFEFNKNVNKNIIGECRELVKSIVAIQNNSYFKNIFKRKDNIDFYTIPDDKFITSENKPVDRNKVLEAIKKFRFDAKTISHTQLKYITGGWFEEYVYQKIKHDEKLSGDKIALNVEIEKQGDKNELDIVYIDSNNKLHVVECKSFIEESSELLKNTIYKAQAIKTKFGLNVKQWIYTKSKVTNESSLKKSTDFGITIIDGDNV